MFEYNKLFVQYLSISINTTQTFHQNMQYINTRFFFVKTSKIRPSQNVLFLKEIDPSKWFNPSFLNANYFFCIN